MRGWLVLVGLFGLACSEGGGRSRDTATAGSGPVGQSGASGGGSAGSSAGSAGAGEGGSAGATVIGNDEGLILGDPLELVAGTGSVPYAIGPNDYGIRGGGFLAKSALGNTITVGADPGKICISGTLDEVPLNPDGHGNYGQYWGVEFGFNLNQAPAEGTPPAESDAGADAAAPMDVAQPWQTGKVVGFSFVIEGPTINLIRFKSLPEGFDSSLESSVFCKEIVEPRSGEAVAALFSELSTYCWSPSSTFIPTTNGLDNISWQLPADVAPAGARPFDWCLTDLRPILTPP